MRILVTHLGDETFKDLDDFNVINFKTTYDRAFNKKFTLEKFQNIIENKIRSRTNKNNKKIMLQPLNKTDNNFYNKNNNFKKFILKKSKLNLPNSMQKKFDDDNNKTKEENLIQDEIPFIKNLRNTHKPNEKISLGEILGNKTTFHLKKSLIEEIKMKDKLSKVNEKNFRSNFYTFTPLEKLEGVLNYKKINQNKKSLVKYLNTHRDNISKLSLNLIVNQTEEDLQKTNKICDSILKKEKIDKILENRIKNKIEIKNNLDRIKANDDLKQIGNNFGKGFEILNKYNKKGNRRDLYIEKYRDMEKGYWKKYNVNRLMVKERKNLHEESSL
jgi:hypothetical protein